MRKIKSLYERDPDTDLRYVCDVHGVGTEWVFAGEGVATRKWDGTCVLVRDGAMLVRHQVKPGRPDPAGFEAVEHDAATGKTVGWVPLSDGKAGDRHRGGWQNYVDINHSHPPDGTYELCGPKVNGNPEGLSKHHLIPHGVHLLEDVPTGFDALSAWLADHPDMEGVVWHHPDGRMAKIKRRDFPEEAS